MIKEAKAQTKQQELSTKLLAKAYAYARDVNKNLLELSVALWELQKNNIHDVVTFQEESGLSQRKTYYLIDIGKAFCNLPITPDQAREIGWTKLKEIAPYAQAENWQELVDKAKKHKSSDLAKVLRGEKLIENERVLTLRLSAADKERLDKLLMKYGAGKTTATNISDRERGKALMKIVADLGF
ncbi:MAG: hypothetical protein M9945_14380 [Aquamicrobium sp.]|uniref:hypothetical protein n=1 Tax=Aquamicrobium sp. TaxID=1872579 RepID=UPI00349E8785|nr:hypothetical protein [Aquamicrobium sp.]